MKALLLPIDNRPVTCVFPRSVVEMAGLQALVPPRQLLGGLTTAADCEAIIAWVDSAVPAGQPDALLLCLDSFLYGGLVTSRRSDDTLNVVLDRTGCLGRWRKQVGPGAPILGQASIMRISDNYDATEEQPYWARYGREIFEWSGLLDRLSRGDRLAPGALAAAEMRIPPEIRREYLEGRWRNFQVNRHLLELTRDGTLDFLAFSLDDSGWTGLNVLEKSKLVDEALAMGLDKQVIVYAGADEVLMALIARWLVRVSNAQPTASLLFSPAETASCQSRYEGQTIAQTVGSQMLACNIAPLSVDSFEVQRANGGEEPAAGERLDARRSRQATERLHPIRNAPPDASAADFAVVVHGRPGTQGDHICLPGQPDARNLDTSRSVAATLDLLDSLDTPCVLCDVVYANGADPALVTALLERKDLVGKLWGYAGWNTTGNSVGSALAMGVAQWFNLRLGRSASSQALKRCLFVRLCDDWAYQSIVRRMLTEAVDSADLGRLMAPYVATIARALDFHPDKIEFSQPWQRTFEIEVDI